MRTNGKKAVARSALAPPISRADFDKIISSLEVSFVKLAECLVAPGWRLTLLGTDESGIHYNVSGCGLMVPNGGPPIELKPHTLVILPRRTCITLDRAEGSAGAIAGQTVKGEIKNSRPGEVQRFEAGSEGDRLILICGYFRACYVPSIDLFASLHAPIVERFTEKDRLDHKLKEALDELVAQEIGTGAITAGLLKLVLAALLRRSLMSEQLWMERFSLLRDPQLSRAFADMVARPSAAHSVLSLSAAAGLSRSAFMSRFKGTFGQSPMDALRQLRMRHAAVLLSTNVLSVDQVARSAGYESRSSFSRAFKKVYGADPTEYRHRHQIGEREVFSQANDASGAPAVETP